MGRFADLKLFGKKRIKFSHNKCMDSELYYDSWKDEKISAMSGRPRAAIKSVTRSRRR